MKVLITGANGLLGQKLVHLLGSKEIAFLATSRGECRIADSTVPYQTLDVTEESQVNSVVATYKPSCIVHTAAMTQVDQCETDRDQCWDLNVNAVSHLIKAASVHGVHLVHLSTDFIFDGTDGPYTEEANANPINYYGESKLAAEQLLINSTISYSILRTVLVYGTTPGISRSNIITWVKQSLESGKEIQVVDDQFRTPTLAEDLAMGCLLASQQQATGIFNISGKNLLTPYDIAQITANHFSLDKKLIKRANSKTFQQPAKRPLKTGFVIDKARKELGYQPHSFADGLALTAAQWDD